MKLIHYNLNIYKQISQFKNILIPYHDQIVSAILKFKIRIMTKNLVIYNQRNQNLNSQEIFLSSDYFMKFFFYFLKSC